MNPLRWGDTNGAEVINISADATSTIEDSVYPQRFGGTAAMVPSQDLVDAFPAANGYPISDTRALYDPANPYENRDPRLKAAIFVNGSKILRDTNGEEMFVFETTLGGRDAPGLQSTSPTSYYVRKFTFNGYNPYDQSKVRGWRAIFYMRWEQMCLIFAEAASKVVSPTDATTFGYSAKQALAWLRSRPSYDGVAGVGAVSDPYLDECAADPALFEALVRNEWRITTCFEGTRYYDLRRWTANHNDLSAINVPVHGVSITGDAAPYSYAQTTIETKNYPSLWNPIPYLDIRRCPNLIQNKGYENWK